MDDLYVLALRLRVQLERERKLPPAVRERLRVARVRRMLAVVQAWQPTVSGVREDGD